MRLQSSSCRRAACWTLLTSQLEISPIGRPKACLPLCVPLAWLASPLYAKNTGWQTPAARVKFSPRGVSERVPMSCRKRDTDASAGIGKRHGVSVKRTAMRQGSLLSKAQWRSTHASAAYCRHVCIGRERSATASVGSSPCSGLRRRRRWGNRQCCSDRPGVAFRTDHACFQKMGFKPLYQ